MLCSKINKWHPGFLWTRDRTSLFKGKISFTVVISIKKKKKEKKANLFSRDYYIKQLNLDKAARMLQLLNLRTTQDLFRITSEANNRKNKNDEPGNMKN